jgi:hypothetical protein
MCFSAAASFSVSGILLVAGIATLRQAKERKVVPFALIPLIFSVQQLTEGVLWIALQNPEYEGWRNAAAYVFMVFAQVVWPVWVPLSVLLLEKEEVRKKYCASFCLPACCCRHSLRGG